MTLTAYKIFAKKKKKNDYSLPKWFQPLNENWFLVLICQPVMYKLIAIFYLFIFSLEEKNEWSET